jgi:hypothetical protein
MGAGTAKSFDKSFNKSFNDGSAETGTAGTAAAGLPNIERIIASAICAGDAAIAQGFAAVLAAGDFKLASDATCGAV